MVAGLASLGSFLQAHADLPTLEKKELLGYFIRFENRNFRYDVNTKGETSLLLAGKKDYLDQRLKVNINFRVEETEPNGQIVVKNIDPSSLTSEQSPTEKPENVVIKGKVTGDATFEVYMTEARGAIILGGKVTNPGTLKNPLRFSIKAKIPNAYPNSQTTEDLGKFEALVKKDRVQVLWMDGKNAKITGVDPFSALTKEAAVPPISAAYMDFSSYEGNKLVITADPNSSMMISSPTGKSAYQGFELTWYSDAAKDPEGKARLNFSVK